MPDITMEDYFPAGSPGDYTPDLGLGVDSAAIFDEVKKALEATGTLPRTGATGVNALGVEDLSGTLKSAEIRAKQLTFWNSIPKEKAYSLVHEWSRVDDLGDKGTTGFIGGNDAGIVTDPTFFRGSKEIRYMAVKGQVALSAQVITALGLRGRGVNVMDTSETLKMLELLRLVERNLWFGDSSLDSTQWDGVISQVDAGATIANQIRLDLQGATPNKDLLEAIQVVAHNNSTDYTAMYWPNEGIRDLRLSLFPQQRMGENYQQGRVGAAFDAWLVEALGGNPDYMSIKRNHMLSLGVRGGLPRYEPDAAAPNAPAAPSSVTGSAGSLTPTPYRPGLKAGTYYYSVTSIGKGGRSLATATTGVAATAGQKITLTINNTDTNALFYEIFRNPVDLLGSTASNRRYMGRTPRTGNASSYVDDGYAIPDTYHSLALSMSFGELVFMQLLPVVKRLLPQELMGNAYGVLLFGTPVVQVPTHNLHVVNIGRQSVPGVSSITT